MLERVFWKLNFPVRFMHAYIYGHEEVTMDTDVQLHGFLTTLC